ncbi:MAG: alpha/beta hydrolase [Gemmatimonadaceae bacterium]
MNEHHITVARRARYYSLGDPATAGELWVVIHGYGQLAAEFIGGFAAVATPGRAVIAPEALNRYYKDQGNTGSHATTPVGTTWMTREFREGEIGDYVAYLDAVAAAQRAPGARLGVLGFSQGVATVARWVALGSAAVDRVVFWAGQLPADLDFAMRRQRFPAAGVDLVLGTRDEFGSWIGIDAQVERLAAAGIGATVTTFEGGHRIDRDALLAVAAR